MEHARSEYGLIQDTTAAKLLANQVLAAATAGLIPGQAAVQLAMEVLGTLSPPADATGTRAIPVDEPVFLIRGQDIVSADAVRDRGRRAQSVGASTAMVESANKHAALMGGLPKNKTANLPDAIGHPAQPMERAEGWYWVRCEVFGGAYGPWTPAMWKSTARAWYSWEFSGVPDSEVIVGARANPPVP